MEKPQSGQIKRGASVNQNQSSPIITTAKGVTTRVRDINSRKSTGYPRSMPQLNTTMMGISRVPMAPNDAGKWSITLNHAR